MRVRSLKAGHAAGDCGALSCETGTARSLLFYIQTNPHITRDENIKINVTFNALGDIYTAIYTMKER